MAKDVVDMTTLRERSPHAQYEVVEVVFNAADVDLEVRHKLQPITPEHIDYIVMRQYQPAIVYQDASVTRKTWKPGIIYLRSDTTGARVVLLLTVGHKQRELVFAV
jgi:hypothetical protein